MPRNLIDPPLNRTFDEVYDAIEAQPARQTPELITTGGVPFSAQAKISRDGRRFISLPYNNRIYEGDWGYMANDMGNDGQRIGQYSAPLDQWANGLNPAPNRDGRK